MSVRYIWYWDTAKCYVPGNFLDQNNPKSKHDYCKNELIIHSCSLFKQYVISIL